MELLLWRWSTAVQVTSLVTIAVFFAALWRSSRRPELKWWIAAWVLNFAALAITAAFWIFGLGADWFTIAKILYMVPKTGFILLLLHGAWALKKPGGRLLRPSYVVPALAIYTLLAVLAVNSIPAIGVVQHTVLGVLFGAGVVMLQARPTTEGLGWLAGGFVVRTVLSFAEAAAYIVQLNAGDVGGTMPTYVSTFLAAHSSFDSGSEWLIALGCVLALSEKMQRELKQSNVDLLSAQENLRTLVDKDPLTGLANRRSMPEIMRAIQPIGATLLFFDLDDFKRVNDAYGHRVGDACLKTFAGALAECFRPDDVLVRYAGDEFLVIARGLDENAVDERVARLRFRLKELSTDTPPLKFSVGNATLAPGGNPDDALDAADRSMYRNKGTRNATAS